MKCLIQLSALLCLLGSSLIARGNTTNTISFGEMAPGSIPAAAQTNFYTFIASSNDVISVALLQTNGTGNPYLYLYDPSNNLVLQGGSTSLAYFANQRLTKNGTFTFVVVENGFNGTYDYLLSLSKAACGVNLREAGDGPETMLPGQSSYGHISPADIDTFCFTANSNDVIYLTVLWTNGPGVSPYLYLYAPDGTLVTAGTANAILAHAANLRLTSTGTYTVGVVNNGLNESFDYLITFDLAAGGVNQREAGDGPEAILPGQSSYGHIGANDYDTFTFTANSNDVIYLTVLWTNGPGVSPYLYLYAPNGSVVTEGTASAILAYAANFRLTSTGTYTVGVVDDGLNESFDYLITFDLAAGGVNQREAGDGPEAILPGQSSYGHIGANDYDTFTFMANSNDVIYLTVLWTNGPGVSPYLYLYAPDGSVVTEGTASAILAYAANLRLTSTGTYTVGVVDNGLNESFDYLITFDLAAGGVNQREAGDGPEAILPGQSSYGHIGANDYDTFTFTANSNDMIYLTVLRTNGPGVSPYLYLYAPNGSVVTEGTASAILAYAANFRLTSTGTYTVGVVDDGLNESFDYLITFDLAAGGVNQREAGDGPEAILPGQSSYGHIGANDYDTFTFTANSNDVIYLTVLWTNGPGVSPYLYLYAPNGSVVTEGTASAILAYAANFRLTSTGTYTVGVVDDGLNESFDYAVSMIKNPGPNFPDPGDSPYAISPGATLAAQITPGDLDAYGFYAIAGDTVTIDVRKTSGTGLNPVLQMYAPDGTVLATDSSPTSAHIRSQCLAQTGNYQAVVYDNGLNEAFGYTISFSQSPIVPPSTGTNQYLAAYLCGSDVYLRWETNAVGFTLESTSDLSPANWLPVDQVPYIIADHYYVADGSATNGTRFYRLKGTVGP